METGKAAGIGGATEPVFEATISPHRSLGPEGFRILMALSAIVAVAVAVRFAAMGFWPVSGFIGLDLLGLYIAFKVSYRRGRAMERIVLTPIDLLLSKISPRGVAREWRLNPLWTSLRREAHAEFGLQRLALVSRGEHVVIAGELSPGEREDFADAFGAALAKVKRGF